MNDECSPSNDPVVLAKTNAPNGTFNPDDSISPTTISGSSKMLKAVQNRGGQYKGMESAPTNLPNGYLWPHESAKAVNQMAM